MVIINIFAKISTTLLFLLSFSASTCNNKPISIAVNLGAPWAYYDEEKGITGIDVEIIERIMTDLGFQTEFHLLAYNRLMEQFNHGKYDMASPAAFKFKNGTLSEEYLPFEDVAVSLTKQSFKINKIDDLIGKRVIAYQHATSVLGNKFAQIASQISYEEMGLREVQVKLLVNNRVDVVIGERRVLQFIINKLFPNEDITIHRIFPVVNYANVFREPELATRFNKALRKLKNSGEYEKILQSW
ncbi:transporter substrate-binding domain-containing protein [Thalassotalea sp. 1_MG-2023]|uniref:substrate-binding periplasmic protein n=1 Tax=Thalassotalea sp. 1_MG-2023 TaxID=3062680 RepID=UPI0026E25705|nr:transporter substrate-binding domain-containing protein [Thalassotalea sp. 1_MG-2023]MDO6427709.1 transporter substrate-binding domain-containing protein [Thalassotalea sp. 1_MG-2023]